MQKQDMKKLAKTNFASFLTSLGNDFLRISLGGGERLHQFHHGVMGSLPVSAGNSILAGMTESGLTGKSD